MQYSPKLKKAMAEIKEIMKREDIAGFVVLHTPGWSEYMSYLDTSYSCASVLPDGSGIAVRFRASELSKEDADRISNGTFNMIHHIAMNMANSVTAYMDIEEQLEKKWDAEYLDGSHTGEAEQNN